jgi:hypothetical protein
MSVSKNDAMTLLASQRKSGRASFDGNGHTIWEWQTTTGVFERHVSDEKLNELTSPFLELVEHIPNEPRKYEGLWVHDAHRPVNASAVRKAEPTAIAPRAKGLLGMLRKLSRR